MNSERLPHQDLVLQLESGSIRKITDISTSASIYTLRREMLGTALSLGISKVITMILDIENVPSTDMTLQERVAYYYLLQEN